MPRVEYEEWTLSMSALDADQTVLRYTDSSGEPDRVVEIDLLDDDELRSLHKALVAYLSLRK
jgi:hypothetical protein